MAAPPIRAKLALMVAARGKVYVVCGNAGVGKTTFAARFCAANRAVLIDIDTVTERIARVALRGHALSEDDRDSPAYKALLRDPIYETLFDVAVANLPSLPCVIVGPFTRERRDPTWPSRLAQRLGSDVEIYYLWCAPLERRRRLEQRGNPRDEGKLENYAAYAAEGEDPGPPPFPHRFIDTTQR